MFKVIYFCSRRFIRLLSDVRTFSSFQGECAMTLSLVSAILLGAVGLGGTDEFQSPTSASWPMACRSGSKALVTRARAGRTSTATARRTCSSDSSMGGKIRVYKNLGDGKLAAGPIG